MLNSALWFFIKTRIRVTKSNFKNNFCSFPRVFYSQSNKFVKSIFTRCWGVLYQPVHPESNISHFHQCSLWGSTLWFFIKSSLRVRKSNFKIIFATFLGWLPVSRANLVNLYLTDFGVCSGNQCTQSQI